MGIIGANASVYACSLGFANDVNILRHVIEDISIKFKNSLASLKTKLA